MILFIYVLGATTFAAAAALAATATAAATPALSTLSASTTTLVAFLSTAIPAAAPVSAVAANNYSRLVGKFQLWGICWNLVIMGFWLSLLVF